MNRTVLVIFKSTLSRKEACRVNKKLTRNTTIIAPRELRPFLADFDGEFKFLEDLIDAGSIYEASAFAEELSLMKFSDGERISKSFTYKGYELWWIHYNKLFLSFCLPYTQYKKLLNYLKEFETVTLYDAPVPHLFALYLQAHGRVVHVQTFNFKSPELLPIGIVIQLMLTVLSIPLLFVLKNKIVLFTSDLFEKNTDFDFRMRFIYEELRNRHLHFTEIIRSLEPWRVVLQHFFFRRRPTIYSESIQLMARYLGIVTFGKWRVRTWYKNRLNTKDINQETTFKISLALQSLISVRADIWAIRMMRLLLRISGTKAAYISAALDRNFHTVLACKLNGIPTVGILHGVASKYYNVYDFLPTYDGEKMMSVDTYGLWSNWWKDYYEKNSKAYTADQLHVVGLMRPIMRESVATEVIGNQGRNTNVLFVSEQLAIPDEVLPYLEALLNIENISVYISFRPYRDVFELWLKQNRPDILKKIGEEKILRNGIVDALAKCDVAVGTHSTAVLEALFYPKPMVFFATQKWGDYFELREYDSEYVFYAQNVPSFVEAIKNGRDIPIEILVDLRERYFGNPRQNGSKWVVDELVSIINH